MTRPTSNALSPSSAHEAAIRALLLQGQHGGVSALAREYSVRREKIYEVRERAESAVAEAFVAREEPARGTRTLCFNEADIARTVIALRVATPSSIRDEVALLPIIYGTGWSYGKVQAVLVEAEKQAAERLRQVDLSPVKNVALDEMFSQGRPVFGGVDLDSGYLVLLDVCPSRSGAEWAEVLGALGEGQGLSPSVVVKDAGSGLAAGVGAAWPQAEERDDLFHAVYMVGKEAAHLERRAYKAIGTVENLDERLLRATTPAKRLALETELADANERMAQSIDRYDRFEALRRHLRRMLALTERGSGQLRSSSEVTEALTTVADSMQALGGSRVVKIATYLRNRAAGLGRYLDALQAAPRCRGEGNWRPRGHGGRRSCVPGEPGGLPGGPVLGSQGAARRAEGGGASPARRHFARPRPASTRDCSRHPHPRRATSRLQQHRESELRPPALPCRPEARAPGLPQPVPLLLEHAQPGVGAPQGHVGARDAHRRAHSGLAHVPWLPAKPGCSRRLTFWSAPTRTPTPPSQRARESARASRRPVRERRRNLIGAHLSVPLKSRIVIVMVLILSLIHI